MEGFLDTSRPWRVRVLGEEGEEELELYEALEGVKFKKEMMDRLVELLRNRKNYYALEALSAVFSPEGDDYSGYALFLLALRLSGEAAEALGESHTYLFGVSEDGGPVLIASSARDTSKEQFLRCLGLLLEEPDMVDFAVIALPHQQSPGA